MFILLKELLRNFLPMDMSAVMLVKRVHTLLFFKMGLGL
jgi:hypothetical protein